MRTYLDYNATMPLRPTARLAMQSAMDVFGNPSSIHGEGREARGLVEGVRAQVAESVGCESHEITFTSGSTEAASVLAHWPKPVSVDATAHESLWVHHRPGIGDVADSVYAMGLANSETGVVADIPEKNERGWVVKNSVASYLLLDITQVVGRLPFSFSRSGADFAILSAHKLGGPKGVGALIARQGVDCPTLVCGGGQEMGRRSGTHNVIGIAGFGAAIKDAIRELTDGVWEKIASLRNILEATLAERADKTIFVGKKRARLPNTSCFITEGWKGETQVIQMDLAGFAVSAGSACSSGKVRSGRVLEAMGYSSSEATSAIRVSLGPATTENEVLRFCDVWLQSENRFRKRLK